MRLSKPASAALENMLPETVEYRIVRTRLGEWRRYLYPSGMRYAEFRSHRRMFGLPVLHYTFGICPETGARTVARGVIAVGRVATGILAIGQAAFGLIAVGQLAVGIGFALGQGAAAALALGQVGLGVIFGVGQLATGYGAIGQLAVGVYVLAQVGFGAHVWTQQHADPEAVQFFQGLLSQARELVGSLSEV
jgi:hypothetical protein